jgi:peptidoglycan/LPS O-acetylase OafA/YrhL
MPIIYFNKFQCATHTFQLSIELQLYALLPLLIWLLYKHPDRGLGVLCAIIGLSTAARYSSILDNRLSLLVFHGMK